jgi:hypothetical protein
VAHGEFAFGAHVEDGGFGVVDDLVHSKSRFSI